MYDPHAAKGITLGGHEHADRKVAEAKTANPRCEIRPRDQHWLDNGSHSGRMGQREHRLDSSQAQRMVAIIVRSSIVRTF